LRLDTVSMKFIVLTVVVDGMLMMLCMSCGPRVRRSFVDAVKKTSGAGPSAGLAALVNIQGSSICSMHTPYLRARTESCFVSTSVHLLLVGIEKGDRVCGSQLVYVSQTSLCLYRIFIILLSQNIPCKNIAPTSV
jgi:hypothetical protein